MSVTVVVKSNRIPQVRAEIAEKVADAVAGAAHEVETRAKAQAPVRTGFLKSSIAAEQEGPTDWRVAANAEYAAHVEFGTTKMGARPFLVPALEAVRPRLLAALRRLA